MKLVFYANGASYVIALLLVYFYKNKDESLLNRKFLVHFTFSVLAITQMLAFALTLDLKYLAQ